MRNSISSISVFKKLASIIFLLVMICGGVIIFKSNSSEVKTVVIHDISKDTLEIEEIILLNSFIEEDKKQLDKMGILPQDYPGGYYRKDLGEIDTIKVDEKTVVTIIDISQEYSNNENRKYTFENYSKFAEAFKRDKSLSMRCYKIEINDNVVKKIDEKLYN